MRREWGKLSGLRCFLYWVREENQRTVKFAQFSPIVEWSSANTPVCVTPACWYLSLVTAPSEIAQSSLDVDRLPQTMTNGKYQCDCSICELRAEKLRNERKGAEQTGKIPADNMGSSACSVLFRVFRSSAEQLQPDYRQGVCIPPSTTVFSDTTPVTI